MLTIGQLARYAGCSVKAVRVYHERGLLAEPARDRSGYRRYDAQAVIDLSRIVTLARSGVPLADIPSLLTASGPERDAELARIDRELAERLEELAQRRRRLAVIDTPDRLCLTPRCVEHLERTRALGFSERYVRIERDSIILASAIAPESVDGYLDERRILLEDDEYLAVMRGFDDALEWPDDDPRIEALAQRTVAAVQRMWTSPLPRIEIEPGVEEMLNDYQSDALAWVRLRERVDELLAQR